MHISKDDERNATETPQGNEGAFVLKPVCGDGQPSDRAHKPEGGRVRSFVKPRRRATRRNCADEWQRGQEDRKDCAINRKG